MAVFSLNRQGKNTIELENWIKNFDGLLMQ